MTAASLWPRNDPRFSVGDLVLVEGRQGIISGVCMDAMYPYRVRVEGESRERRPIFYSIEKADQGVRQ